MKIQSSFEKSLVFSGLCDSVPQVFIAELEEKCQFFGNGVRADSRIKTDLPVPLRISVYRPEDFVPGVPVGFRMIFKRVPSGPYHKLVIVPKPDKADERFPIRMPLSEICRNIAEIAGFCETGLNFWLDRASEDSVARSPR